MATKSSNPDLGALGCDGCGGFGVVRQQKTGRKLLYFYCENCGMDKRSGKLLQAKWRKAIDEQPPEMPALNSEPVKQEVASGGEWMPQEVKNEIERINNEAKTKTNDSGANDSGTITKRNGEPSQRIENETDRFSSSHARPSNGFGFFIFGAFAGLAAIAGIRR
ncbi:hypothetical protein [Pseudoalteromonas sp. MelDa3]|uniref:hypothetical protein n=1 Tax=Pseudoalteromonas sp. MelDa3 TaxID=888435 RepID=UPI000CC6C81A|nr:hypothetical protein [Pseudoalteromonas sp. MelDa3]PLT23520.1 hypothetical protein CXF89_19290 [Pseudoalteromonas sp. MelDa3]